MPFRSRTVWEEMQVSLFTGQLRDQESNRGKKSIMHYLHLWEGKCIGMDNGQRGMVLDVMLHEIDS